MFRCGEKVAEGEEYTDWLRVIWAVNEERPGTFGAPEIKEWWAGGMVEEYDEARVILVGDGTVRLVGKTDEVDRLITQKAVDLGLLPRYSPQAIEALGAPKERPDPREDSWAVHDEGVR